MSELRFECNTPDAGLFSNVAVNSRRGLPQIATYDPVAQPAVIVGGGPSLATTLEKIKEMKAHGARIFALNNSAKYLYEHGCPADVQIMLDPRTGNIDFLEKRWCGEILLASQCDPSLFERCKKIGYPVRLWHPAIGGIEAHVPEKEPLLIGGGLTVGLSGLCLVYTLGHRNIHLFGYDSCHSEAKSHAYPQSMNDKDEMVRVAVDGRVFDCSLMMAGQAHSFQTVAQMLADLDCEITVHGDGLIPHLVKYWQRIENQKILSAVYDLGMSPPTYDFISFLVEAERHRIAKGFDVLDVVFQPGPMLGFRDDNLPPDTETRKAMLWRVCVGLARLMPSVRNVEVLIERKAIAGDVFPEGWNVETPSAHYGTQYLKNGSPMFKSSDYARRQVCSRFSKPYATISLRESKYWTQRNSNKWEWVRVADWLHAHGIQTVVIPDTDGDGFRLYGHYTDFPAAAFDIDLRAALYEGAVINLGVSNGPMALCPFLECKYLTFNVAVDGTTASSDFLKAHGINEGEGLGGNGRWVWKPDTYENIINELEYLTEKTSCPA